MLENYTISTVVNVIVVALEKEEKGCQWETKSILQNRERYYYQTDIQRQNGYKEETFKTVINNEYT